jgi:hypothetical protein
MAIHLACPGCKALLQVDDSLAGKQGKCIHCGHRITVPGGAAKPAAAGPISQGIFEATPEAMIRELASRGQTAALFLFSPSPEGSYDLADVPDSDLKCIVTDDINAQKFAQFAASVSKRFGPRKKGSPSSGSMAGQMLYELKGDRLGMSFDEFKQKYARESQGGREKLPLSSDDAWGPNRAALHVEPWHKAAGIVHARIDLPAENDSPTVAGVKTELLLYHFIDNRLFRISAFFPTDQFHVVSDAAGTKYGLATKESQNPRQLLWENSLASVVLSRGMVHPPTPSTLVLIYKPLAELAESRAPKGAGDF